LNGVAARSGAVESADGKRDRQPGLSTARCRSDMASHPGQASKAADRSRRTGAHHVCHWWDI